MNENGTLILGIDPGLGGAIALYNLESGDLVELWDFPLEHNIRTGARQIHPRAFAQLLRPYATEIIAGIIEDVGGRKNDGVTNAFKFGYSYGIIRGTLRILGIPMIPVLPQIWKPMSGLNSDKDLSRAKAAEKFPGWKWYFVKKVDHDRAEAALLAVFGEKFFKMKRD